MRRVLGQTIVSWDQTKTSRLVDDGTVDDRDKKDDSDFYDYDDNDDDNDDDNSDDNDIVHFK